MLRYRKTEAIAAGLSTSCPLQLAAAATVSLYVLIRPITRPLISHIGQHDSYVHRYRYATSRKCADRVDSKVSTTLDNLIHKPRLIKHRSPQVLPPSHNNMGLFSRLDRPAFLATTVQRSPEEKVLVRRLDCFLLFFGCISQVIKYLDQQNIKFENSPSPQPEPALMLTPTI
jgi:hypothetical protein